jgi:hypothetical protein
LPARIRVFIDYMMEQTRAPDVQCLTTMTAVTTMMTRMATLSTVD